jgi:hypothetical protein
VSLLIEEAKKLYEGWNWEQVAEKLSPSDRGAFLAIVGSYQDLIKEIERLQCYEVDYHKAVEDFLQQRRDYEFTIINLRNQTDKLKEQLKKHQ